MVHDVSSIPPQRSLNFILVVDSGAAASLPSTSSLNGITVVNGGAASGQYPIDSADGSREGKGCCRDKPNTRCVGDTGKTAEPDCTLSDRTRNRVDVPQEEEKIDMMLFIGTRFSNLYTSVHTPA
jgi:hypothetical protein